MSSAAVRAGGVFVEIGADPRKFFSALSKVNKSLGNMGRSLASGGGKLAAAGIGMAAPIAAAVRQGAAFESTLLNIRASTGATSAQIDQIKASSMAMSQALGVGPTEAAEGMLALLKAGMELPDVLGGAGKSALEFASVGQVAVGDAAEVLTDIINVFGGTAAQAANVMSSAADSSSVSIDQMVQAFSQASAVAKQADQSLSDTSAAIAILGAAGIKGSDAGTSLKSMFLRLINPASDAEGALNSVGLTAKSFIDLSTGKMKAMPEMFDMLNQSLSSKAPDEARRILAEIFGSDAVRAAAVFTKVGSEGFAKMSEKMKNALPVSEKYKMMMSGLAGSGANVLAALQRMAIAVSDAVAPALASVVPFITGFIDGLTKLATDNKEAVAAFAKFAVAAVAVGSALVGLGVSLQVTSFGLAGIGKAAAFALSPLTMLIGAASKVGQSFALVAMPATLKLANSIGSSMLGASASVLSFAATAGGAMAGFAASSTTALAGFAASSVAGFVRMSGAASAAAAAMFPAFFTGFNRGISAGAGFFSATLRGLNGVVMASSTLRSAMFAVSGSGMARFVGDIVGGLTLTYKSFVWWATGATARMAQYAANLTGAVGKTIASTAAMSAAWVGSALRGVGAFVASAVAGLGSYLAASAMAVAGSVASAAAVAAAWLAPLAPLLLLSAAALGVGAAVKQFAPQITSAFSSLAGYVSDAGGAIAGGFSTAISDGIVVLGDLATTATTTFNGVYEAVAAGDLSGAMDILWAGLVAGWLRGTEALMSYVDPWVAAFQDVFTDIGSGIYIAWDTIYTNSASLLNTMGAYILGFFDSIANGVMATFDNLVAGIQIAWTRVQGFITGAKDTEERVQGIKDENAARAEQRAQERPGIMSRMDTAAKENAQAEKDRQDRVDAINQDAQATKDERQATNQQRADDRRAGVEAAEGKLAEATTGASERRKDAATAAKLMNALGSASSLDDLTNIGASIDALIERGNVGGDVESKLLDAYYAAFSRVNVATANASTEDATKKAATAGANAAGTDSSVSKSEVAGTFSANLGGMGFGSSLAERTAKAAEETAKNTRKIGEEGAVAA
jgi:TP901 family phage tail tape measure protein